MRYVLTSLIAVIILMMACSSESTTNNHEESISESKIAPDQQWKEYWFDGTAEITSYKLKQARYGEIHEGEAVLVYVTEPFSKTKHIKLDNGNSADKVDVLKLNHTRKFNTGIYPYSLMASVFQPVEEEKALKVTMTSQEWCGHSFMSLDRASKGIDIELRSYFESEGNVNTQIKDGWIEDEIWTSIRLNPDALPIGNLQMLPSSFHLRFSHTETKALPCVATLDAAGDQLIYTIEYSERSVKFWINSEFPHTIDKWEETAYSGWGAGRKKLTTTATLNKQIKTDYWTKNSVSDGHWREKLGLE